MASNPKTRWHWWAQILTLAWKQYEQDVVKTSLVGGYNPFQKYLWIRSSSPGMVENATIFDTTNQIQNLGKCHDLCIAGRSPQLPATAPRSQSQRVSASLQKQFLSATNRSEQQWGHHWGELSHVDLFRWTDYTLAPVVNNQIKFKLTHQIRTVTITSPFWHIFTICGRLWSRPIKHHQVVKKLLVHTGMR